MSKPNFRRRGLSGWQLTNRRMQRNSILPEGHTRWHRFLYGLGIKEDEVRGSLSSDLRKTIVEWARKHADQCYVPSYLLIDAGIKTRYDS